MSYGRKEKNVARWSADDIKGLRQRYDETQRLFCRRLGVTPDALQHWEQGRGGPSLPVEMLLDRLLEDIDNNDIRPHPDSDEGRHVNQPAAAAAS